MALSGSNRAEHGTEILCLLPGAICTSSQRRWPRCRRASAQGNGHFSVSRTGDIYGRVSPDASASTSTASSSGPDGSCWVIPELTVTTSRVDRGGRDGGPTRPSEACRRQCAHPTGRRCPGAARTPRRRTGSGPRCSGPGWRGRRRRASERGRALKCPAVSLKDLKWSTSSMATLKTAPWRDARAATVEVLLDCATVGQARQGVAPSERVLAVAEIDQVLLPALP